MEKVNKHPDWLLTLPPRPVQSEANLRSYPKPSYALFMEMRTGKTAALLNEFLLFKRDYGIKRLLVIAPNKYKYGWKAEAEKFGVKEKIHVYESSQIDNKIWCYSSIVIANYEALRYEDHFKTLQRFNADMVVFDESILAKNRTTHAFKRGLELTRGAKITRILTGKPVVQGPHDLWSQLRLIKQLDGFNYFAFRNWFCKMGGFMAKQVVGYREENRAQLQAILNSCSFIASRKEWGKQLDSDYETRSPEILPIQAKHYKEMEQEFITYMKSGQPVTADQVVTKHIKLQQISSGFLIDENKKVHQLVEPEKLPKLIDLKESLDNEVSHKALIICFYVHSMETLFEQLKEYNPAIIGGNVMMKRLSMDTEQQKNKFNCDPTCKILVGQISAIKFGHNLSAQGECDTTFYYENTYSLDDRAQSEQRNQGSEQISGIHIIDYAATKVERQIIKALQRKENVAQAILGNYEVSSKYYAASQESY